MEHFRPHTYRFVAALDAHLLSGKPVARGIDIGCGAGPGDAIVIGSTGPEPEVLAVDFNDDTLRLTAVNAALAVTPDVRPVNSDLLSGVDGAFNLIVANPPLPP